MILNKAVTRFYPNPPRQLEPRLCRGLIVGGRKHSNALVCLFRAHNTRRAAGPSLLERSCLALGHGAGDAALGWLLRD